MISHLPRSLVATAVAAVLALPSLHAVADPVKLLADPTVQKALETIKQQEPEMLDLLVKLTEIPAPPFMEQARAAEVKKIFESLGLENVFIDKAGNVLGTRRGVMAKPNLAVTAHLDTVFPEGTDVKVRREGTKMIAPGISDDTRGLVEMISVIRALNAHKIQTQGTITFVATVGEEGLGDLRGVKELFNTTMKGKIDSFISIDGGGTDGITNGAVGSYRYRVTYRGPGGHSYGAFGMVNPAHALGRAIAKIADVKVPSQPKTTYTVGRIGGGTSVNSIPFEAWMEIDMRSEDTAALNAVRDSIMAATKAAVTEENSRWPHGKVEVDIEQVGDRPAGGTSSDSEIVQVAQSVIKAFGGKPKLGASSTDSNYPMNLGIPAITVGKGGVGTGAHSLAEAYDPIESWKGPQHTLLLVLSLTQ
ncbi:M20/M25/M40 family metallo-hydrolase [Oleiharenicola lentus]|uniref:M20/M25/M40 family metallo-hydrolase n=1 Tax=Oleiharenicola lentus TaxID=2508720 RepID=UPI003F673443